MSTTSNPYFAAIIKRQLLAGIEELENSARNGQFNKFDIRAIGNAALILGEVGISCRAALLLSNIPDEVFWAGAITNFELPTSVPEQMRTLDEINELEKQIPKFFSDQLIERCRNEEHFERCLNDQFSEATHIAGSGLMLEEVGAFLAILGKFDEARLVANDPNLEAFRQNSVSFVILIELFRYGRTEEAIQLLNNFESEGLGSSGRASLALGIAGRVPWGGYPFPDW